MNNIQLATTLVAPTGTGFLFVPFSSDANSAVYKQDGASGRPALLAVRRVLPKAVGDFPGVERGEIKLTEYVTVNSVEYSVITTIASSVPVPVGATERTNQATRTALIAGTTALSDLVRFHRIPL